MKDNKKLKDGRDRSKIDVNDPSEVEWLHRRWPGCTHRQIIAAIQLKGPVRKDVTAYLESKHAAK